MGIRGPISGDSAVTLHDQAPSVPTPEADWHKITLADWEEYWTSDIARAVEVADYPVIYRLFRMRDEQTRNQIRWAAMPESERFIEGSHRRESIRLHPLADRMRHLEADILKLEKELGLTPLSRARLGIEIGQSQLTWDQVNKQITAGQSSALPVKVIDTDVVSPRGIASP